jgi:hypothetical protein
MTTIVVVALLATRTPRTLLALTLACLARLNLVIVFTLAHVSRLNSKTRGMGSADGLDRRASPGEAPGRALSSFAHWRFSGFEKPEPGNLAPRAKNKP